jgi:ribosome assembly protein RRB1
VVKRDTVLFSAGFKLHNGAQKKGRKASKNQGQYFTLNINIISPLPFDIVLQLPNLLHAIPQPPTIDEEDMAEADTMVKPTVWMPGRNKLEDGETLQYDPTAYDCMSSMSLEWPSLSFDMIPDSLGDDRRTFPHTLFMVAGTQAAKSKLNYLAVMKVSNLTRGRHGAAATKRKEDDSDSDDDMMGSDDDNDSDEEIEEAKLHVRKIAFTGGINRVRAMPQTPSIVASWADTAQVQVFDLSTQLAQLAAEVEPASAAPKIEKVAARQVHAHSSEGFAMDWSSVTAGRFASGDCRARIHIWEPTNAGKWLVGGALKGHEGSVEDLQWSPTEGTVFASCSVDKTIRVWDTRDTSRPMLTVLAHDKDVNVVSWNRLTAYMLASGGDEGALRVWDLRTFTSASQGEGPSPVANFTYHRGPVTSLEWCPHEASMLCTTSEDDTCAVWDLALERDPEEEAALAPDTNVAAPEDLPAQLLFLHAGQTALKEAHWHRQIPGLLATTAGDGFNLFKPSNL